MRFYIGLFSFIFLSGFINLEDSIYDINITTQEGVVHPLQDFRNKKILMVILPTDSSAASIQCLRNMDSIATHRSDSITVIGVSSFEDEFQVPNPFQLHSFYRSILSQQVIITKSMYTRKGSASMQHPLFKWLTHTAGNGHFNYDVEGVGQFFVVNETGDLIAVYGRGAILSHKLLNRAFE